MPFCCASRLMSEMRRSKGWRASVSASPTCWVVRICRSGRSSSSAMNRHVSPSSSTIRILGMVSFRRLGHGQLNREGGAASRFAHRANGAAVPGYDVFGDAESEPRAAPGGLGRDPGLENAGQQLRRDAPSRIADLDLDGLRERGGADAERTTL